MRCPPFGKMMNRFRLTQDGAATFEVVLWIPIIVILFGLVTDTSIVFGRQAEILPAPVDLVWTTQNYHDIRQGRALLNKAVFAALKPGGTYFIVDHSAVKGADEGVLSQKQTSLYGTHR